MLALVEEVSSTSHTHTGLLLTSNIRGKDMVCSGKNGANVALPIFSNRVNNRNIAHHDTCEELLLCFLVINLLKLLKIVKIILKRKQRVMHAQLDHGLF